MADLGLDARSVASALLHDAVEDTGLTLEHVTEEFGPEVGAIVDGVTKLDRLQFDSKEAQQAATVRKMLVAMAKDWRVLVIKLADRLHNMRTVAVMPDWKQRRTAQETLDIYAPLAHRLGIQELKWQLEDLAFATLHPKRYAEIEQMVATRAPERDEYLARVLVAVRERLERFGGQGRGDRPTQAPVEHLREDGGARQGVRRDPRPGRPARHRRVREGLLGRARLHPRHLEPGAGPLQGLHQQPEVQPLPVPAHHRDRARGQAHRGPDPHQRDAPPGRVRHRRPLGLQGALQGRRRPPPRPRWRGCSASSTGSRRPIDPLEFLETLKLDLEQDEVYVFTPKGKVIALAAGSTPIDFAYSIHTEVGHRCIGAKVNGRLVPLTRRCSRPTPWRSSRPRSPRRGRRATGCRSWRRRGPATRSGSGSRASAGKTPWRPGARSSSRLCVGKGSRCRSWRRRTRLERLAAAMNYVDLDSLHASIGDGHVSARSVAQRLARDLRGGGGEEQLPTTVGPGLRTRTRRGSPVGVYVEGLDDVMVRLSRCCTPVPGDQIVGFVTRGRGVSVHRADCANATALAAAGQERLIEVEWDREGTTVFVASIEVLAFDRSRLLSDVTRVVSEHHLNIVSSSSQTAPDRVSRMNFDVELADPGHLESLISSLKHLDGVFDAFRTLPGRKG